MRINIVNMSKDLLESTNTPTKIVTSPFRNFFKPSPARSRDNAVYTRLDSCNTLCLQDVVVDHWWCRVDLEDCRPEQDRGIREISEVALEILVGHEGVGLTSSDSRRDRGADILAWKVVSMHNHKLLRGVSATYR